MADDQDNTRSCRSPNRWPTSSTPRIRCRTVADDHQDHLRRSVADQRTLHLTTARSTAAASFDPVWAKVREEDAGATVPKTPGNYALLAQNKADAMDVPRQGFHSLWCRDSAGRPAAALPRTAAPDHAAALATAHAARLLEAGIDAGRSQPWPSSDRDHGCTRASSLAGSRRSSSSSTACRHGATTSRLTVGRIVRHAGAEFLERSPSPHPPEHFDLVACRTHAWAGTSPVRSIWAKSMPLSFLRQTEAVLQCGRSGAALIAM